MKCHFAQEMHRNVKFSLCPYNTIFFVRTTPWYNFSKVFVMGTIFEIIEQTQTLLWIEKGNKINVIFHQTLKIITSRVFSYFPAWPKKFFEIASVQHHFVSLISTKVFELFHFCKKFCIQLSEDFILSFLEKFQVNL